MKRAKIKNIYQADVIAAGKKYNAPLLLDMMGVDDQFGLSGAPMGAD